MEIISWKLTTGDGDYYFDIVDIATEDDIFEEFF